MKKPSQRIEEIRKKQEHFMSTNLIDEVLLNRDLIEAIIKYLDEQQERREK